MDYTICPCFLEPYVSVQIASRSPGICQDGGSTHTTMRKITISVNCPDPKWVLDRVDCTGTGISPAAHDTYPIPVRDEGGGKYVCDTSIWGVSYDGGPCGADASGADRPHDSAGGRDENVWTSESVTIVFKPAFSGLLRYGSDLASYSGSLASAP